MSIVKRELTPEVVQLARMLAPSMHACRFFGVANEEQAEAVMLTGFSFGFDLVGAFRHIHIIDGKPSLSPAGAWALVLNSGLLEDCEIDDIIDERGRPVECKVMVKRRGLPRPYSVKYSIEDARAAGLTEGSLRADGKPRGRGNWEKYPANMLRWRAIGYVTDIMFADILGGLKRADELIENSHYAGNLEIDAITGEVIEVAR